MSIEIKITLPSAADLSNNGWARNSIFRIIEGGGQVESSAIMSIYRSLDKRKRLDFIKRALPCCAFTRGEVKEILTNHKRSQWIQAVAVICQPTFSKEDSLQKFEEIVKKSTGALDKAEKEISALRQQRLGNPWQFSKLIDDRFLRVIIHCLENNQVSQISIDEIDEDLLYGLSASLVGAYENSGIGYISWYMRRFMDTIANGTRASLFVPFVSSSSNKIEITGTHYLTQMYQKGGK